MLTGPENTVVSTFDYFWVTRVQTGICVPEVYAVECNAKVHPGPLMRMGKAMKLDRLVLVYGTDELNMILLQSQKLDWILSMSTVNEDMIVSSQSHEPRPCANYYSESEDQDRT